MHDENDTRYALRCPSEAATKRDKSIPSFGKAMVLDTAIISGWQDFLFHYALVDHAPIFSLASWVPWQRTKHVLTLLQWCWHPLLDYASDSTTVFRFRSFSRLSFSFPNLFPFRHLLELLFGCPLRVVPHPLVPYSSGLRPQCYYCCYSLNYSTSQCDSVNRASGWGASGVGRPGPSCTDGQTVWDWQASLCSPNT